MKTLTELQAIRDKARGQVQMRGEHTENYRVVVAMGTCGIAAGARAVLAAVADEVAKKQLYHVTVMQSGCIGICPFEPVVEVFSPEGQKTTYVHMTAEKAAHMVESHLKNGSVVTEYTIEANP